MGHSEHFSLETIKRFLILFVGVPVSDKYIDRYNMIIKRHKIFSKKINFLLKKCEGNEKCYCEYTLY